MGSNEGVELPNLWKNMKNSYKQDAGISFDLLGCI